MPARSDRERRQVRFAYPLSLWRRFTIDGCCRIDPPAEWPRAPCWIWNGAINGDRRKHGKLWLQGGYGYVRGPDQKPTRVHILTYRELRGPIDAGLVHRHTCDVRTCGSPWHIDPGTIAQNNEDTWARGGRTNGNGQHPPGD